MKRFIPTAIATSGLLVFAVACGPGGTPSTGSTNVTTTGSGLNQTGNNVSPSGSTNVTNNTVANGTTTLPVQLKPFQDTQGTGLAAQIPAGWTSSRINGGNYGGWKFVNPQDANQQVVLVKSACVGCYMVNGKPDPKQPIPEQNATGITLTNQGLTATYQFTKQGNPNTGWGLLTVTSNASGYGYIQVLLPASDLAVAQQILTSFHFSS
ncbi:hypothetical protein D2Q93_14000 [Alicyclobacillaceae bacterium I2511]|nr:hypothetical protein D2Q93_14000 [Alicyclobacillaceae bacterium I2511]